MPIDKTGSEHLAEEMSLVDIAEELSSAASRIEAERSLEREARAQYQQIADRSIANIEAIKKRTSALIAEQERKLAQFGGMIEDGQSNPVASSELERKPAQSASDSRVRTLGDAILRVWDIAPDPQPLTTTEILEMLPKVGYKSKAAPKSLKSSLNQVIAKLCSSGSLVKYRTNGARLNPANSGERARKYLARKYAERAESNA